MFSAEGKTLLRNIIRHTDTHNRMVEEAEMWRQKDKNPSNQHDDRDSYGSSYSRGDNSSSSNHRAHMDDLAPQSTYWMRELEKFESQQPDRWGHGGFKEMYPEEFRSDRSDADDKQSRKRRKKKEKKSKKRKKLKYESDSDDDSDPSIPAKRDVRSSHHKKRHKEHKRKSADKLSEDRKIKSKHKKRDIRESEIPHKKEHRKHRGTDSHRTKSSKKRRFDRNTLESQNKSSSSSESD